LIEAVEDVATARFDLSRVGRVGLRVAADELAVDCFVVVVVLIERRPSAMRFTLRNSESDWFDSTLSLPFSSDTLMSTRLSL
jgi:hypothetical protein